MLPDVLRNSTLMQYVDLSRNYFRGVLLPAAAHALMHRHSAVLSACYLAPSVLLPQVHEHAYMF
jgi:hypothetical protein